MDKIKLKISEFARCLSVQNAYIQMYVKRHKIILNDDRLIDLSNPVNKFFLESQISKGKSFDFGNIFKKEDKLISEKKLKEKKVKIEVDEPDQKIVNEIENSEPKINTKKDTSNEFKIDLKKVKEVSSHERLVTNLAEKELKLKIQKLEIDNEIKMLQKNKIEGSLVPVDAMKNIFIWSIDTFHNSYLQQVNNIANVYVQILGADTGKFSAIIKELSQALTRIKEDAKSNLISGIEGIVEEYQEVRGRGERK